MKKQKGFTLIEILIYTGAIVIIGGSIVGILTNVITVQTKQKSSEEVTTQLNFVMQTIRRLVAESSLIDNSTGGSVLALRMGTSTISTTTIYAADNAVTMKVENEITGTSSISTLTNTKVILDQLNFTKVSSGPGHDVVQIDIQLSYNTENPSAQATRNLQSSIARISAATFDSNLIPNTDNTFSIGLSPGTCWKNACFSGNVYIGGDLYLPGLQTGADNTVVLLNSNKLVTDEIDSRVWGSSLVDKSGTSAGYIPKMSDSNTITNSTIYDNGKVGIGTTNPLSKLSVGGDGTAGYALYSTGANTAIFAAGSGYGIQATGNIALYGNSSESTGVYGVGGTIGVRGSGGDSGVYGTGGDYGVYGTSNSGYGVYGYGASVGMRGGGGDYGVWGTGSTYGVYGNGSNYGVYGYATGSGNYAGYMSGDFYVSGTCSGSSSCNSDIAEKWVSEKALEHIHCGEDKFDYLNKELTDEEKIGYQYACVLDSDFELEFESGDAICFKRAMDSVTVIDYCEKAYDKKALSTINYNATINFGPEYYPYPVSLAGNIPIKVICDDPIEVGDSLVASDIPGYAMRIDVSDVSTFQEFQDKNDAVFAKALEPCSSGRKIIRGWKK